MRGSSVPETIDIELSRKVHMRAMSVQQHDNAFLQSALYLTRLRGLHSRDRTYECASRRLGTVSTLLADPFLSAQARC